MLYNININQEAAVRSGLPVKIYHLAVIAVMKNMFASPEIQETWYNGKCYKWIAIQVVANELPLFDLKKRRISEIISELEDMEVVVRHPENQKLRKSFFRAGSKWSDLFTSMQKSAEITDTTMQKNAEIAMQKNAEIAMHKNADNHRTNNHNTNNHNTKNTDVDFGNSETHPSVTENRERLKASMNVTSEKLPFESDAFKAKWELFKTHLQEKGKRVTTTQLNTLGSSLIELSGGSESKAIKVIEQAIKSGWGAFYPLKEEKQSATNNVRSNRENRTPFVDNDDRWTEIQTPEGIMRIRS